MKHILFDFARTIVEHPADSMGLSIVRATGLTDEEDISMVRNAIFSVGKYLNNLDDGSMSRDEYRKLMAAELPERLRSYAIEAADYHMRILPPIPGMKELLVKLRKDGYKLYILSNLDDYHTPQMQETEYVNYFDGMFFSCEVGVRKPYKEFFEEALKRFNLEAEDCLFIDDLEENVEGAEACGIRGFVFTGDAKEAERFIYSNNN